MALFQHPLPSHAHQQLLTGRPALACRCQHADLLPCKEAPPGDATRDCPCLPSGNVAGCCVPALHLTRQTAPSTCIATGRAYHIAHAHLALRSTRARCITIAVRRLIARQGPWARLVAQVHMVVYVGCLGPQASCPYHPILKVTLPPALCVSQARHTTAAAWWAPVSMCPCRPGQLVRAGWSSCAQVTLGMCDQLRWLHAHIKNGCMPKESNHARLPSDTHGACFNHVLHISQVDAT